MPLPNPEQRNLTEQAEAALKACLRNVPTLDIVETQHFKEFPESLYEVDFGLKVESKRTRKKRWIFAEVKSNGEPRNVRTAVNDLARMTRNNMPGSYGVLVAPYLSSQAADLCRREGYGYVDLAGNCHLAFDEIFIHQEGRPNPYAQKRDQVSLYKPKAERILRVLLSSPHQYWRLQLLAGQAEVSLGYVHKVKELLLDYEWVSEDKQGLLLADPLALLTNWGRQYDFRRSQARGFHSLAPVAEVERKIAVHCERAGIQYAFTGFSAADRIAPHVRYQRVHAYISSCQIDQLHEALSLQPVTSGANVHLLDPYDSGVFYGASELPNGHFVSPIQAYLDLLRLPGRGEDAAEFLLDTQIKPAW